MLKRMSRGGWVKWMLAVVVLAAWGCTPAREPADEPEALAVMTTAGTSSYQDDDLQPTTPDPVADPEAGQTAAPGVHLDAVGTVTALDTASVTVDGMVYELTASSEIKGSLAVGSRVKLEYVVNADGSRTVIEAKSAEFFEDSGGSDDD